MEPTDPLSQYLALLRIRQRAARRNGWFLSILMLASGALGVYYLRQQYQIEWGALQFPFIFLVFVAVLLMQAANESMLKSIIELVEAIQRPNR
jgi:uncharacterized membrane protein YfcA